jgi:regulator of cell morphogenesis and NO signaling
MSGIKVDLNTTIGGLVAQRPGLARLFEMRGVDYCCGGKKTVAEVCEDRGWDAQEFIGAVDEAASADGQTELVDAAAMSLVELADHIVATHHAYLKRELPRLQAIIDKVARAHGDKDSRLLTIREIFGDFTRDLSMHMFKEEQVLFPFVRQLAVSDVSPSFHCGSVGNPIRQMEVEHQDAGLALARFRALTDDYTPPVDACNTYRVMLDSLSILERDMHQHVHKEDNILFPRALERERDLEPMITT